MTTMTKKKIMMTMVKVMLMMISSLTQERREDMLSRETPTTWNTRRHNLNILQHVDIFDEHYNFKIKDQVDIVILVLMIGPTLNRRPLLIWLSISREDSATAENIFSHWMWNDFTHFLYFWQNTEMAVS